MINDDSYEAKHKVSIISSGSTGEGKEPSSLELELLHPVNDAIIGKLIPEQSYAHYSDCYCQLQ